MKSIKLFALLAVGLLLTSCNDWLQENPRSFNEGEMFTDAEIEARVNSLYRRGVLVEMANAGSAYIGPTASVNGMLTGYFTNSYEGQETHCKYAGELTRQEHTNDISARMTETTWERCYQAIVISNQVINTVKSPKFVAEAKFFRAFNYFYLVKMFGDVPLILNYTENAESENLTMPRTNKDEVIAQVKKDLNEAVADLDNKSFKNNGHRISKAVAAMLLADVSLYTGDYQNAEKFAKVVINTPEMALLKNGETAADSYINQLRTKDDNSEVVYAYEFNNANSTSGWWPTYAFNASATGAFKKYSIFERVYGVANGFLDIYEENDLRIQNQQFFVWKYEYDYAHDGTVDHMVWEASDKNAPGSFYFYDKEAMEVTGRGTHDFNVYRLAEAYLIAAEAIAQNSGVTAEALGYLNALQTRAGETLTTTTDKTAFIEAVWTERLKEFPLEFKIWDDCVRTGKFPKISANGVQYVDLATATNARGASFSGKSLLWPIGVLQLQRNPNLTQNPGY